MRRTYDYRQPGGLWAIRKAAGCEMFSATCKLRAWGMLCLLAGALAPPAADGQCHYTYIAIPNPPGGPPPFNRVCRGGAINSLGHVTGIIVSISDFYRSFIWTPENGTVELPMPPGINDLVAIDINDLDHVAGYMSGTAGSFAFLWDGQEYHLIEPPEWANGIGAAALNNNDEIIGTVLNNLTGPQHVFWWADGVFRDLGPDTGVPDSWGSAINELGHMAGYGRDSTPLHRAFLLDEMGPIWLPHPDALDASRASELNCNGFVVGEGNTQSPVRYSAIVWTPWELHVVSAPLGSRDAYLRAVNSSGRAVGGYSRGVEAPIAWQSGSVRELASLIVPIAPPGLVGASDINNAGQILLHASEGTIVLNPVWLPGDLTGDCHVSLGDLLVVLSNFGSPQGTFPRGDVNTDGEVDLTDLAILLTHWGD